MDENKNLNNQPEKEEDKKKKKCGFLVWWNKLSKGAKIGISAAAGVALTSAIVFPTLAVTVWNKKEVIQIPVKYDDYSDTFYVSNYNLVKDTRYTFTINMADSLKYKNYPTVFSISKDLTMVTDKFVKDLVLENNKKKFTFTTTKTNPDDLVPYEYMLQPLYEGEFRYMIGKGSFNETENLFTCTFTAKDSGTVTLGAFSEDD